MRSKVKEFRLRTRDAWVLASRQTGETGLEDREGRLRRILETEVWPHVPPSELGRTLSRDEEEEILGYGKDGT